MHVLYYPIGCRTESPRVHDRFFDLLLLKGFAGNDLFHLTILCNKHAHCYFAAVNVMRSIEACDAITEHFWRGIGNDVFKCTFVDVQIMEALCFLGNS